MKSKILIAAALFVSAYFLQSCSNSTNNTSKNEMDSPMTNMAQNDSMNSGKMQMDNAMMQAMSGTMSKMNGMKMTGDFDIDFANMMIMHHQAAIDMSEVEIAKGTDAQIKTMAQNIITTQNAEIAQLQAFIKNYNMPEAKKENGKRSDELSEAMKIMIDKMNGLQLTGNTDKDFVMMMIPHHESAITMVADELVHGKQLGLIKMAQKISVDQSKEINEFKAWGAGQK